MRNIILIGMPGSGKTTVANMLKDKYGKQVRDTDEYIENRYGSISDIFAEYGERHFRSLETEAVREICKIDDCIISTGGGCVMSGENVKLLKDSGKIVYLKAGIETLLKRLEGDSSRPLLVGNKAERIKELFEKRSPVYERVADIVIDTDGLTPDEILENIMSN